jgi:phosphate transport system substrate-binding protein
MHKTPEKPASAAAALKFFDWVYTSGDAMAAELEYVALPDTIKTLVRKQWASVKDMDGKALAFK